MLTETELSCILGIVAILYTVFNSKGCKGIFRHKWKYKKFSKECERCGELGLNENSSIEF